jgi:hypothetical protein
MKMRKENWSAPMRPAKCSWGGDRLVASSYCSRSVKTETKTVEVRGFIPAFGNRMPTVEMFDYLYEMSRQIAENRRW